MEQMDPQLAQPHSDGTLKPFDENPNSLAQAHQNPKILNPMHISLGKS
jgi:hypothetical protein